MVDTTLEIYKNNVPLGYPVIAKGKWDSTDQDELVVTPESGYILFVKGVSFLLTDNFALSGTDAYMRFEHSSADGSNKYTRLDIGDENELLALCEANALIESLFAAQVMTGSFCFMPPIRCRSSASEYFHVVEEATLTVTSEIYFTVHGWQMLETEYDGT